MYKKSKKLIVWCLVVSMVLTQMMFTNAAFAATSAATRLAGTDRYQTAIEVSKAGWTTSDYAVLAYGEDFPDALTAAPLAKKYNAPILLTGKATLADGVLAELQRLGVKNVFVVGGEGVVSAAVADALTAAGMTVERLSGADRYATALAVANKMGTSDEVVVAYGENYPDALSISAIAAAKGMPILLTDKNAMSADVKAYIGTKKAYVVGGEGVVSATVFNSLTGAVRLGGADRYATNVAVMNNFAADLNFGNVFVATGENFADALAGSAYAAMVGAPIVLTYTTLADGTKAFLNGKVAEDAVVIALGGVAVVSDAAVAAVKAPVVAPTTLQVESVSTLGLNGIKVVFSQEIDKETAEKVANYSFDGVSLTKDVDVAKLASDNKTLTIIKSAKFDQFKKVLFTVSGNEILSKDTLSTVPKLEQEVTFSDTAVPAVEKVSVTGNKKITVQFTEPVKMTDLSGASSLFKINGQYLSSYGFTGAAASILSAADANDNNAQYGYKLDLSFNVAIPAGTYTLKTLKGTNAVFSDAAGYMVPDTETSFTVDAVTTAPQIVSITAETNGVAYVTFDRAMDDNAKTAAYYTVNNASNALGGNDAPSFKDGSGNKIVKVKFDPADVKEGANIIDINYQVKDAWGNKLHADTNQRYSFSAVKDTTKPAVSSVVLLDDQTIRVKFTEDVSDAYAGTKSNYTLKKSSGEEIAIDSIVKNTSDTYSVKTDANNKLTSSGYTLKIKNIIDLANPANTMDEYVATVNGKDEVAPEVKANSVIKVSGSKVAVYFSEAMDPATITDKANYAYLNDNPTATTKTLPSSATITVGEGNKYVTIEFPTGYEVTTALAANADAASNYKVTGMRVSNVKDVAGNVLKNISFSDRVVEVANAGSGNPSYTANSFKLYADTNKAWAEFELNQTLTKFDKADFMIGLDANTAITADSGYVAGKKIVLEFNKDGANKRADIMAMGPNANLYTAANVTSANISGIKVAAIAGKQVYDDAIKPEWDSVVTVAAVNGVAGIADGTTVVTLQFSENLDNSIAGLYNDDFTFTTSNGVLLSVDKVVVVNDKVYYKFTTDITGATVTVKAQSNKIDIKDVKDSGVEDQNLYVPTSGQITGKSN